MSQLHNLLHVCLCASVLSVPTLGLGTANASCRTQHGSVACSDHSRESDLEMSSTSVKMSQLVLRHRVLRQAQTSVEESAAVDEKTSTDPIVSLEEPLRDAMMMIVKLVGPRMIELAYDPKLSTKCLSSLRKLWEGLTSFDVWAMKMLDSSGRPPAGLMQGNIADLGAYDECLSISAPPSSETHFQGQYCSLFVKVLENPFVDDITAKIIDDVPVLRQFVKNVSVVKALQAESYVLGLRMGVCIPSTCRADELKHLVTTFIGKYGGVATVPACKVKTPVTLNTGQIVVISFLASLGVLIMVASIVDVYCVRAEGEPVRRSLPIRLLLSFSAVTNTIKLFSCEVEQDSARSRQQCIHGIRVLGAMWVMLVHNYILVEPNTLGHALGYLETTTDTTFAVISNGLLCVDTFFFLSGFIITQMVLPRKTKNSAWFLFITTAYARYIRISIPALFLVAIVFVYPLFVSGPVVDQLMGGVIVPCQNHWWDVLTHTTNFRYIADMCAPHLWYIAADFQMYIFFLVFLVASRTHPRFGLTGVVLAALGSCIGTSLQAYVKGYLPFPYTQVSNVNNTLETFEYVYFKPYCHMAPFAVGVVTAYLFMKKPQKQLSVMQRLTGWTAAAAVGLAVVFGVHPWSVGAEYPLIAGSLYAGFNRLAWSIAVAWVLYTCCTGNGGQVNAFLSHKVFVPFSRLSFSVYLVHMLVVLVKPAMTRFPLQWTHWMLVKDYFGCSVISFIFAYLFFIFCEAPLYNLDKLLIRNMIEARMRDVKGSTTNRDPPGKGVPEAGEGKECGQQPIQTVFVIADKLLLTSSSKL